MELCDNDSGDGIVTEYAPIYNIVIRSTKIQHAIFLIMRLMKCDNNEYRQRTRKSKTLGTLLLIQRGMHRLR